jgi:hypothetical protein
MPVLSLSEPLEAAILRSNGNRLNVGLNEATEQEGRHGNGEGVPY